MGKTSLSDLGVLLDLQTNASQTKLRKIKDREEKLQAMLVQLSLTKKNVAKRLHSSDHAVADFQNDMQHLRWVDQRRAAINIELAQVMALIDMATQDLSKHFARQQALEKSVDKQAVAAAILKERRAGYGS